MLKPKNGAKFFEHSIPPNVVEKYPKFTQIAQKIDKDPEIHQLWHCCNVMAIDRLKINDHGVGHIRLVLKHAIQIFELLRSYGIEFNIVKDYGLTEEEALIVVLLASCLHDIGHIVTRKNHGTYSLSLSKGIIQRLLHPHYKDPEQTIIYCEALHAMYSHMSESEVSTVEGGIVRVADALDIKAGRASEALKLGKVDIHSISATSIQDVQIVEGKQQPVHVNIEMTNTAGIFQVDSLLKRKLQGSGIEQHISVYARILGGKSDDPVKEYKINI